MTMSPFYRKQAGPAWTACALALAFLLADQPAVALAADGWEGGFGLVGADGPIHTAIVAEDSITVGGDIDVIGGAAVGNIARWDGDSWNAIGNPFNGTVRSLAEKDGILYAGGDFTKSSFANMPKIAKWNGTQWSALGTGIQGPATGTRVNAVAFYQDNLYVAGNFTKVGGENSLDIGYWDGAAWHAVGGTDSAGELHEMVVYDDELCVVGAFEQIGNVNTEGVACWDGQNWHALGSGLNGAALAVATHNGFLYVGGSFTFAGGKSTGRVARWDGTTWSSIGFPLQQVVSSIGFRGNTVVVGVGGGSTTDPDHPWLIEWNGASWSPADIQPDGLVHALVASDFGLLAVGAFPRAGQVVLGGIGFWSGLAWTTFVEPGQRGLHGTAEDFATFQGQLYVAGNFRAGGEVPATLVARWNVDRWEVVANTEAGASASVDALAVLGDELFAGGNFSRIGGMEADNVARWDGVAWSPVGDGLDDRVSALHVLDGKLYAGGSFDNVATTPATPAAHVAAWDGQEWSALGGGVDGNVLALTDSGGDLIVGGAFLNAGGPVAALHVARWNGSSWSAVGAGFEGTVYALHDDGETLYAGGAITATGLTQLSGIAKWSGSQWLPLGSGLFDDDGIGTVRALTSFGGNLLVGGSFKTAGGVEASQIARYDGSVWFPIPPGFRRPRVASGERVDALLVHDQSLWVGGSFVELLDLTPAARVTSSWQGCILGNEIACVPTTTTTTTTIATTTTTIATTTTTIATTTTTILTTTTLPGPVCGDANDDGNVTATDALIALRAAVGSSECAPEICDVDSNGSVSASDALAILRNAVGQPNELDCPA